MAGQAETQPVDTADSIGALLDEPDQIDDAAGADDAPDTSGADPDADPDSPNDPDDPDSPDDDDPDDDPDAPGKEDDKDEPTETIKHDGKEVTLKKSEILELAQKGFDYTKKTMALADERKAFDSEREKITQEAQAIQKTREESIEDLRAVSNFIEGILGEPPDISLAQQDASLYLVKRQQHDQLRDKLNQARQALTFATQQADAERQHQLAAKQAATEKQLIDTLPGWKENPKAKFEETASYLQSLGLNGKNAGSAALEPAFWQLAVKAQAFDQLQQKKAAKPAITPTKVAKPGSANPVNQATQSHKAKLERFSKAPSLATLGDLL